jgi:hypothetical protein
MSFYEDDKEPKRNWATDLKKIFLYGYGMTYCKSLFFGKICAKALVYVQMYMLLTLIENIFLR